MIDTIVYIMSLNATEAGEAYMRDRYITITKKKNAKLFFQNISPKSSFEAIDFESGRTFYFRFEIASNGEQRIYQLGDYCREKGILAGDSIILERHIRDGNKTFYINYKKHKSIALLHKMKDQYIVERNDYGDYLFDNVLCIGHNGVNHQLKLTFNHRGPKRKNSPDESDFYDITVDGRMNITYLNSDKYIIIDIHNCKLIPFVKIREYSLIQE